MYCNDKNYVRKRLDINNLAIAFCANNGDQFTKFKFNYNNKSINLNSINYSLNYIREPKDIINNEKFMIISLKRNAKKINII